MDAKDSRIHFRIAVSEAHKDAYRMMKVLENDYGRVKDDEKDDVIAEIKRLYEAYRYRRRLYREGDGEKVVKDYLYVVHELLRMTTRAEKVMERLDGNG